MVVVMRDKTVLRAASTCAAIACVIALLAERPLKALVFAAAAAVCGIWAARLPWRAAKSMENGQS